MDISGIDEDTVIFRYQCYECRNQLYKNIMINQPCGCNANNPYTTLNWSRNTCSCCHKKNVGNIWPVHRALANKSFSSHSSLRLRKSSVTQSSSRRNSSSSKSPVSNVIFKKFVPKCFVSGGSRFSNLQLDKSFLRNAKSGLSQFWPKNINDVDRYWILENNAVDGHKENSFYKYLTNKRKELFPPEHPKEMPEIELISKLIIETKAVASREEIKCEEVNDKSKFKVKFSDIYVKERCQRFLTGKPCSSNCRYRHVLPKEDGIVCKYYYLHIKCDESRCIFLHSERSSLEIKEAYHDKWAYDRCINIMKRRNCPSGFLCKKIHRHPKDDGVYCIYQIDSSCFNGSNCKYLHRDDLISSIVNDQDIAPADSLSKSSPSNSKEISESEVVCKDLKNLNAEDVAKDLLKDNTTGKSLNYDISEIDDSTTRERDFSDDKGKYHFSKRDSEETPKYTGVEDMIAILGRQESEEITGNRSNNEISFDNFNKTALQISFNQPRQRLGENENVKSQDDNDNNNNSNNNNDNSNNDNKDIIDVKPSQKDLTDIRDAHNRNGSSVCLAPFFNLNELRDAENKEDCTTVAKMTLKSEPVEERDDNIVINPNISKEGASSNSLTEIIEKIDQEIIRTRGCKPHDIDLESTALEKELLSCGDDEGFPSNIGNNINPDSSENIEIVSGIQYNTKVSENKNISSNADKATFENAQTPRLEVGKEIALQNETRDAVEISSVNEPIISFTSDEDFFTNKTYRNDKKVTPISNNNEYHFDSSDSEGKGPLYEEIEELVGQLAEIQEKDSKVTSSKGSNIATLDFYTYSENLPENIQKKDLKGSFSQSTDALQKTVNTSANKDVTQRKDSKYVENNFTCIKTAYAGRNYNDGKVADKRNTNIKEKLMITDNTSECSNTDEVFIVTEKVMKISNMSNDSNNDPEKSDSEIYEENLSNTSVVEMSSNLKQGPKIRKSNSKTERNITSIKNSSCLKQNSVIANNDLGLKLRVHHRSQSSVVNENLNNQIPAEIKAVEPKMKSKQMISEKDHTLKKIDSNYNTFVTSADLSRRNPKKIDKNPNMKKKGKDKYRNQLISSDSSQTNVLKEIRPRILNLKISKSSGDYKVSSIRKPEIRDGTLESSNRNNPKKKTRKKSFNKSGENFSWQTLAKGLKKCFVVLEDINATARITNINTAKRVNNHVAKTSSQNSYLNTIKSSGKDSLNKNSSVVEDKKDLIAKTCLSSNKKFENTTKEEQNQKLFNSQSKPLQRRRPSKLVSDSTFDQFLNEKEFLPLSPKGKYNSKKSTNPLQRALIVKPTGKNVNPYLDDISREISKENHSDSLLQKIDSSKPQNNNSTIEKSSQYETSTFSDRSSSSKENEDLCTRTLKNVEIVSKLKNTSEKLDLNKNKFSVSTPTVNSNKNIHRKAKSKRNIEIPSSIFKNKEEINEKVKDDDSFDSISSPTNFISIDLTTKASPQINSPKRKLNTSNISNNIPNKKQKTLSSNESNKINNESHLGKNSSRKRKGNLVEKLNNLSSKKHSWKRVTSNANENVSVKHSVLPCSESAIQINKENDVLLSDSNDKLCTDTDSADTAFTEKSSTETINSNNLNKRQKLELNSISANIASTELHETLHPQQLQDATDSVVKKFTGGQRLVRKGKKRGSPVKKFTPVTNNSDKLQVDEVPKTLQDNLKPMNDSSKNLNNTPEADNTIVNVSPKPLRKRKTAQNNMRIIDVNNDQNNDTNLIEANLEEKYILNAARETLESFKGRKFNSNDICAAFISLCEEHDLEVISRTNAITSLDKNIRLFWTHSFTKKYNLDNSSINRVINYNMKLKEFAEILKSMEQNYFT